jgi:DNA-directed RNA polymerase subunit H (RpoH/RPB5)
METVMRKSRKAIIVISLIKESSNISREELEKEILSELSKDPSKIPWAKKIDKVTITNS